MSPQQDFYRNISEMRDHLDTLVKRGKPVTTEDLQKLIAIVETKSQPQINLSADKVAKLLAPQLLPLLPTPESLAAAGKKAAGYIEAAITVGTQESINYTVASVQRSTERLAKESAALAKAANAVPKSVTVDLLDGWKWPVILVFGTSLVLLLFLWGSGTFSGVARTKYEALVKEQHRVVEFNGNLARQGGFYRNQVRQYVGKHPKAAAEFPEYVTPRVPDPEPISIMHSVGDNYKFLRGF